MLWLIIQETRGFLRLEEASTATYAAILDRNGDYQFGVGDMAIHDRLSVDWVSGQIDINYLKNKDKFISKPFIMLSRWESTKTTLHHAVCSLWTETLHSARWSMSWRFVGVPESQVGIFLLSPI